MSDRSGHGDGLLPFEIYYVNSHNDRVYFDRVPFILTDSGLFDSRWTRGTVQRPLCGGCIVTSRRRGCEPVELTLEVTASSRVWLAERLRRLAELLDYDTALGAAGRLYINGQYLLCRCSASEKKLSCDFDTRATVRLTLLPESPLWYTEKHYRILGVGQEPGDGLKYPYGYPKKYGAGRRMVIAENSHFLPAPVKVTFYGEAEDPKLYLGTQVIGLNVSLAAGEYAVIDQLTREIYSVSVTGERTNRFDARDRGGGVFTYLPQGSNMLTLDSGGGVDITLYERRSEPGWALN